MARTNTTKRRRGSNFAVEPETTETDVIKKPADPGIVVSTTSGAQGLDRNMDREPNYEVGTSGLAQFSGLIFQEPLVELRGKEAYKRYDEMRRNSPIISALLLSIENPIRSTSWTFASDQGDDDPRLEIMNRSLEEMEHSFNDHISEILTFLPFGFSIFEPVYQMSEDGTWLWKKFAPRAQNTVLRWIYQEIQQDPTDISSSRHYRLAGFEQLAPPKYKLTPIPIERLVIYRLHAELDNPEGRSMLRSAWIPYFYIKHLQQIEAIGAERDLAGMPVITLPEGATTSNDANSDLSKAKKIVRNVRNDEQAGIVLPAGWTFELLRGAGTKQFDVDKVINRYEKRILTSALAQFLMLGQEGIGSLALSKDQTDFFTMSVNAIADIISQTFTKYCIPPLMQLNGYDADGLRLDHTPAQGETSIQIMATFLQQAGQYLHMTPEDEVWLRQLAGMPEMTVEEIDLMEQEKEAQRLENQKIMLAKLQGQSGQPPAEPGDESKQGKEGMPPVPPPAFKATAFRADPKDIRKRREFEKKWAKAFGRYQTTIKKNVMKAMKERPHA